jgi:hypothetical protein
MLEMVEAQRARRLDLQLLRRLGPELHVLDRRHAQLDRPFYETQSFRGQNYRWARTRAASGTGRTRRRDIMWGPRANVNMQESAILISMNNVAKNKKRSSRTTT